ncbi:MAG: lipopolysaccharide biosynthesis protein [Erythrobacter sp.]
MNAAEPASFAARVRSAVLWRSGSQIGTQLVSWASTLIVIRLLAPEDYGLFAMAGVVLVLLNTMNGFGLASALIREAEVTEERLRQTLGMLILMNAALAIVQFLAAPLVAAYFREPLVADVLRVQTLIYVTVPFNALSHAILSRKLDFRRPAQVRLVGAIVGAGTALSMALAGFGVWTLVAAPIAMYFTEALGMMIAARTPWRPSFRFAGAGHIAGFGGMMTVTQLFWFIQSQADVMIAGRVLDAHWLGVYTTGLFLAQLLASKFVPPINEVAFAAYSRQQRHGPGPVLATIRLVLLIALPAYAGMAAVAPQLVAVVLGEQWHEAAPILPILALAMSLMTLQILFSPATNALGEPKVAMRISMLGAVIMPSAFWIGSHYGVEGFAWGWAGGMAVLTSLTVLYSGRVIGLSLRALSEATSPIIFAAATMGASVYLVRTALPAMADFAQLLLLVPLGAAIYVAVLFAIAPDRLIEALRFARNRRDEAGSAPAV